MKFYGSHYFLDNGFKNLKAYNCNKIYILNMNLYVIKVRNDLISPGFLISTA